jgi:hypothetical protein
VALRPFGTGLTACLRAEELRGAMWPTEAGREAVRDG